MIPQERKKRINGSNSVQAQVESDLEEELSAEAACHKFRFYRVIEVKAFIII